jgi:hypothetical protein
MYLVGKKCLRCFLVYNALQLHSEPETGSECNWMLVWICMTTVNLLRFCYWRLRYASHTCWAALVARPGSIGYPR